MNPRPVAVEWIEVQELSAQLGRRHFLPVSALESAALPSRSKWGASFSAADRLTMTRRVLEWHRTRVFRSYLSEEDGRGGRRRGPNFKCVRCGIVAIKARHQRPLEFFVR